MPELASKMPSATFDQIANLLATRPEFREAFAIDPVVAVQDAGIRLGPEETAALSRLASSRKMDGPEDFDDRLVLCSSSGY